jgi:hypothetical protein
MGNTSTVASVAGALAKRIDRGRVWARIMGKTWVSSTRTSKDSVEHIAASMPRSSTIDSTHNRPAHGVPYTLRVKPDRRQQQLPIEPGAERRRL